MMKPLLIPFPSITHLKDTGPITRLLGLCFSLVLLSGCAAVAGLPPHIVKELTPATDTHANNYVSKEAKP